MWLLSDASTAAGGGDNLYTLLISLAVLLLGSGGLMRYRQVRHRPEVDPEPVARRVAYRVEDFLQKRVRQLEREQVELERQLNEERAKTLALTEAAATLRAERAALMERIRQLRGIADE